MDRTDVVLVYMCSLKGGYIGDCIGDYYRVLMSSIMDNQMEKKMENEMETGIMGDYRGYSLNSWYPP